MIASVYSLPYVVPPWKKTYCLFPQPLGGPRPIWATNIQTGIFVSWEKETADTHSRWDDTLPYKCWPSDIPQHSQAASTPRDKHKCRDKRAGVMTSPLPVYALPVLYAPVLKQRAKCLHEKILSTSTSTTWLVLIGNLIGDRRNTKQ